LAKKGPTEEERLDKYFDMLRREFPNPPKDWEKNMRPCKWAKILEEKDKDPDGSGG